MTKFSQTVQTQAIAEDGTHVTINVPVETAPNPFSEEDLRTAFEKVENADHWKNPVKAFCKVEDRDIIERAIEFYTGSEAVFYVTDVDGWLKVEADGYFVAIGS